MKIYMVFPGPLFPIVGMSQVRMLNQIKGLGKDHELIFSDIISKGNGQNECKRVMRELGVEYRPVFSSSYGKPKYIKTLRVLAVRMQLLFTASIKEELFLRSGKIKRQILEIVEFSKPKAVMIHYWYLGSLFKHLGHDILKFIDTHYLVEEHVELMRNGKYSDGFFSAFIRRKKLNHCLAQQRKWFLSSDLIIVNSAKQARLINAWEPRVKVNVTVNGQDLKPYLNYQNKLEPETAALFYGSLGNQFNRRALHRILSSIFPKIKESIPDCKLYIVGVNPPLDLVKKVDDESIVITGFVEDVKPHLSKCKVMLMPLETGSGFRGRTVELLALGIPIVGTSNGLQSVGFVDKQLGFLAETDDDIASKAIYLLRDPGLWQRMSENCRSFAESNFSIEHTYGKLAKQLTELTMQ